MAITINGTGSITGLTAGGLPDGSIVAGDLASSLDLTGKTVTLPSGTGGKILQIQHVLKTDAENYTGTLAFQDISGLSVNITPSANDSQILLLGTVMVGNSDDYYALKLLRGSTALFEGNNPPGSTPLQTPALYGTGTSANSYRIQAVNFSHVDDSHSSGGTQVTYKLQIGHTNSTSYSSYINLAAANGNNNYYYRPSSSLIAIEVAA